MSESRQTRPLIEQAAMGNRKAIDELFQLTYRELRKLAAGRLAGEQQHLSLEPTALVNEAFLRLVRQQGLQPRSRAHFFSIAAEAMRRIVIEAARRRGAAKRGGGWRRVTLVSGITPNSAEEVDIVILNTALEGLSQQDGRMARIVTMRFFGGLSVAEVAEVLGVSKRTVESDWTFARAWLRRTIVRQRTDPETGEPEPSPGV